MSFKVKKYTVSDHLINQTAGFTQALQRLFVDTWYAPVCASAAHSEGHHMKSSGAGSVMWFLFLHVSWRRCDVAACWMGAFDSFPKPARFMESISKINSWPCHRNWQPYLLRTCLFPRQGLFPPPLSMLAVSGDWWLFRSIGVYVSALRLSWYKSSVIFPCKP